MVEVLNHPNWLTFFRTSSSVNDSPRVIMYINIKLSSLHFSLCKNIFNHRDISITSFFNQNNIFFLINVYSDFSQLALKYLKNTKVNINNILIMMGNFNIRDSLWDPDYQYHSIHSDLLFDIIDTFFLGLSVPINQVSTRYPDNNQDCNYILDLMFLRFRSEEINKNSIYLNWYLMLDHALLIITLPIIEKHIQIKKYMIVKDSKKEKTFVNKVINAIKNINTSNLSDIISLKNTVCTFACSLNII